jgi:hypothetical protein
MLLDPTDTALQEEVPLMEKEISKEEVCSSCVESSG